MPVLVGNVEDRCIVVGEDDRVVGFFDDVWVDATLHRGQTLHGTRRHGVEGARLPVVELMALGEEVVGPAGNQMAATGLFDPFETSLQAQVLGAFEDPHRPIEAVLQGGVDVGDVIADLAHHVHGVGEDGVEEPLGECGGRIVVVLGEHDSIFFIPRA